MDTCSSSSDLLHPLAAPPTIPSPVRVTIPSCDLSQGELPMVTPNESSSSLAGNSTAGASVASKEKVGRWSDQEHQVFLEGLEKHGKQWKTIAGMIGTRTVVQVRTHAQKYFQKMERKQNGVTAGSDAPAPPKQAEKMSPQKRKSLPGTLPSSCKKKAKKSPTRFSMSAVSSSNLTSSPSPVQPMMPTPNSSVPDLHSYAHYASNSSSGAIPDNWSIISPTNVASELLEYNGEQKNNVCPHPGDDLAEVSSVPYEFNDLGEDPLEWLIDIDSQQYLPESSLPTFPDLGDPQIKEPAVAPYSVVDDAVLNNIVDPNVTMQSLFLSNEDFQCLID